MSEWIKVEDRLPNDGDYVLTYSCGRVDIQTCYINSVSRNGQKKWYFADNSDDWIDDNVSHWMPLPTPPKD
jgi:hypothetical protein